MAGKAGDVPVDGAVPKKRLTGLISRDCAFGLEGVAPLRLPCHVIEDHADGPELPEVL